MDEEELSEHLVDFDKQGRLISSSKGTRVDTTGQKMFKAQSENTHIFAMDPKGRIAMGDPKHQDVVRDKTGKLTSVDYRHHSSFFGGKDLAGGGEIKASNGKLKLLTNQSGHHRPSTKQTHNVVKEMKERGGDLSDLQVQLYRENEDGSNVSTSQMLDDRGRFHSGEVLASQGSNEKLFQKKDMLEELRAVTGRAARKANKPKVADVEDKMDEVDEKNSLAVGKHRAKQLGLDVQSFDVEEGTVRVDPSSVSNKVLFEHMRKDKRFGSPKKKKKAPSTSTSEKGGQYYIESKSEKKESKTPSSDGQYITLSESEKKESKRPSSDGQYITLSESEKKESKTPSSGGQYYIESKSEKKESKTPSSEAICTPRRP